MSRWRPTTRRMLPSTARSVARELSVAVAARSTRSRGAGRAPLHDGLAIVGMLAPLVMIAGLGDSIHEVAWFVWYGWGTSVPGQAAEEAPVWLAWLIVAPLALLGCRRLAAIVAWLAAAGMLIALALDIMLPTAGTGGWILLAVLAALALTFSPDFTRGGILPPRSLLLVASGVAFVLFARLLGHHYTPIELVAWIMLGAAVTYASRPSTAAGRRALLLLSLPAISAICTLIETEVFALYIAPFSNSAPWPLVLAELYGVPAMALVTIGSIMRYMEKSRGTESTPTSLS